MAVAPGDPGEGADREVWWGGYWGPTLLPSWVACALLAALLAFLTWEATKSTGYGQVAALAVAFCLRSSARALA